MQPRPEAATSLHTYPILHPSPSSRNLAHFDYYPRISIHLYWWEAIVESVTGHQPSAPRMLILLKCPLVEGELRGGSMGGGRLEVVSPLARVSSRCSRFTKDDRGRLFRRWKPTSVGSNSGWWVGEWVSGWLAGWLDHPPCGSLKWPTSIEMEVYRDRLVDEAGDSRWLVQITV